MNRTAPRTVAGILRHDPQHAALVTGRPKDCIRSLEAPVPVRFPCFFEFKVRRLMIPAARLVDKLGFT